MRPRLLSHAGLSLVEVTIIISVMAVISSIMAPAGIDLIAQAREVRAVRDGQAIREAVLAMLNDLGKTSIRIGTGSGTLVELLVSGGVVPEAASPAEAEWIRDTDPSGAVDLLDRYLVTNEPAGNAAYSWQPPGKTGGFGWRGAYLKSGTGSDPWGYRYAVNVKYLGRRPDVLVLSAGANGLVETPFEASNLKYGGDDIAVLAK